MNTEELKIALRRFINAKLNKGVKRGNGTLVIQHGTNEHTIPVNSNHYTLDVQRMICVAYLKFKPKPKEETTLICKEFIKKHGSKI